MPYSVAVGPLIVSDSNQSCLFCAANGGFNDIVTMLLQTSIDKDLQSSTGKTALYAAAEPP